jgi:hypothetical protein
LTELIWRFEYLKSKITLSSPLLTKHTALSSVSIQPYSSGKIIETLDYEFNKINDCIKRVSENYKKVLPEN